MWPAGNPMPKLRHKGPTQGFNGSHLPEYSVPAARNDPSQFQVPQSGVLRKNADQVGAARKGAVTHAGGKAEVVCYADI